MNVRLQPMKVSCSLQSQAIEGLFAAFKALTNVSSNIICLLV